MASALPLMVPLPMVTVPEMLPVPPRVPAVTVTLPEPVPESAQRPGITVHDVNLIGEYNIKMSTVYFKDAHKLEHIWMGLSNPDSDNFTKVQGMLKASFSV